jgi:hypothetical protein
MKNYITVSELIAKLEKMGDDFWKKNSVVRIMDKNDNGVIDHVEDFDIRYNAGSLDIFVDIPKDGFDWDDSDDDFDDDSNDG